MPKNLTPVPSYKRYLPPYYYDGLCDGNNPNLPSTEDLNNQTIEIYSGSTLTLNFLFPFSLNGNVVSIVQAKPENLITNAIIEYIDEFNVKIIFPTEVTSLLPISSMSRIRMGVTFPDGTQRNYNNILIKVV